MVDEINGSIDIVTPALTLIQLFDDDDDDDDDENDRVLCSFNDHQKPNEKEILIVRLPEHRVNARPLYSIQRNHMELIRKKFQQEQNRVLLKSYKSNSMYSCTRNEFEEKISTFMSQTNAYSLIEPIGETRSNCVRKTLDHLIEQFQVMLNDLLQHQFITTMQYHEMKIQRIKKVQLDHLFFLPDTRKVNVAVFFYFSFLILLFLRMKFH